MLLCVLCNSALYRKLPSYYSLSTNSRRTQSYPSLLFSLYPDINTSINHHETQTNTEGATCYPIV